MHSSGQLKCSAASYHHSGFLKYKQEIRQNANVQAAHAAAKAVLKTPFRKQTSSATSKKQRTPTQRLVSAVQGEGSGEVMSPRAGDALISEIAQCIAQEGLLEEKGRFVFFFLQINIYLDCNFQNINYTLSIETTMEN